MSPRKYEMRRRAAGVEATRSRILAATRELHEEQGIVGTSWDQIARKAGVGVGTVYRHFPTLDELVPACGALVMEALALPEDAPSQFVGVPEEVEPRLRRLTEVLFGIWERGARSIEVARREHAVPGIPERVRESYERFEQLFDELVDEALRPLGARAERDTVRALTEIGVWRALTERGIEQQDAVDTVTRLLVCWLSERC
jgi:AcrR family transcriptional regulator